ncbi:MAG: stage II sporulation protein R [Alicyclobacillaceae bacterium]|nr:stage II sporulation protein R [Alicyclobacillaceae bacterium]
MGAARLLSFVAAVAVLAGCAHAWEDRTAGRGTGQSDGASVTRAHDPGYSVGEPSGRVIPSQALRLRIVGNSDSPADQALKRAVRDAIIPAAARVLKQAHTPEQARMAVERALPELQAIAEQVVRNHGFHYSVYTTVSRVPFPTKMYGNQVYPAGDYEALYIRLGSGQGQNWWCVLFPPLCFVDIADGDAVPNTAGFPDLPPLETVQVEGADGHPVKVAVRLAAADYGEEMVKAVTTWFVR